MVKYKFLPVKQIISYFNEDISYTIAQKRYNNRNSLTPITIQEENGNYFLISGFYLYDALCKLNAMETIPCIVQEGEKKEHVKDRLLLILRNAIKEESNWKLRYTLINMLINDCLLDRKTIAHSVGKDVAYISNYLLFEQIPDYIKEKAIEANCTGLVNEIHLHPTIPEEEKNQFYQLAITGNLTYFQLYCTTNYYNVSYYSLYSHPFAFYRIVH